MIIQIEQEYAQGFLDFINYGIMVKIAQTVGDSPDQGYEFLKWLWQQLPKWEKLIKPIED